MKNYFNAVLNSLELNHIKGKIKAHKNLRDKVKELIEREYNGVYGPINSGSIKKATPINTKFDLDIVIPFKRNSFKTLDDMHENLYSFLRKKYSLARKQTVSVGITTLINGYEVNLDVVPGRELSIDDYPISNNLNLNINTNGKQSIKTNIQKQIEHIRNSPDQTRNIVKLLKNWKNSNNIQVKSFVLELFTIKTFEHKHVPQGVDSQLKTVLQYIQDNIESTTLLDPGNSGNNVLDSLSVGQKSNLKYTIKNMLKNFDNNYKLYFPGNAKFISVNSRGDAGYSSTSFG